MDVRTIFLLPTITFFFVTFLNSCCSDVPVVGRNQNRWEVPLNVELITRDTVMVDVKDLKLKLTLKPEVGEVKFYRFWLGKESISFYSYNDNIFTASHGYGEGAILLKRGNYEIMVGKPKHELIYFVMPVLSCCVPYVHPDIPDYGIQLTRCEESSGIIRGKIKLGADIPNYSSLKFTIVEKGDDALLKHIVLER